MRTPCQRTAEQNIEELVTEHRRVRRSAGGRRRAYPRGVKRFAPLLVLACAPAAPAPHVAIAPTSSASAAPIASASAAAAPKEKPLEKDEAPPSPIARVPLTRRLAANGYQTCVVNADHTVTCWGTGALQALTLTNPPKTPITPTKIANLSDAVSVAVAVHQACALRQNGKVACWGQGTFPTGDALDPKKAIDVPQVANVTRIAPHRYGVCAIGKDLTCFADAQPFMHRPLPVPASDIVDADGGDKQLCVVAKSGAVHCLGSLSYSAKASDDFQRMDLDDAIAVEGRSGCAVLASGYRACWAPKNPISPYGYKEELTVDRKRNDYARAAGDRTSCWLFRDRHVECSGDGKYGQHGDGLFADHTRYPVFELSDAIEIAAGFEHVCALRANNEVICWGGNNFAQLGDGRLIDRSLPRAVLTLGGKDPGPLPKPGTGAPIAPPLNGSKAPWRESESPPPTTVASILSHPHPEPSAIGTRAALFESGLAMTLDDGLIGPIAWPNDHKAILLDGSDAVWIGMKDGLLRAANVKDAKKGAFKKVLALPYAVSFASAKGFVVAADAKNLHVTRDGGQTFTKITPTVDVAIDVVYARSDGLIAIVGSDKAGETKLYLARDGAKFELSTFQPKHLYQSGQYLFAHGCPGAILSSDGKTWNKWDRDYGLPASGYAWSYALNVYLHPSAFDTKKLMTLNDTAPAPDPNPYTGSDSGSCGGGGSIGVLGHGGLGYGKHYRSAVACSGASCIRGTFGEPLGRTPTMLGFYNDGACEADAKGQCVKWTRMSHVSSTASKAPLDVPAGCDAKHLLSAGGIGVLFCAKDESTYAVHAIGKDSTFKAEGTVPAIDIDRVTIASDGTWVVHPRCKKTCGAALIRAPLAVGASNAWRATTVADAFAYRALPGGNVLVMAGESNAQDVSFFVDRASKPQKLATVTLLADLIDVDILKDRIVVYEQNSKRSEWKSYVAADGLVKIEEPKPEPKPLEGTKKPKKKP